MFVMALVWLLGGCVGERGTEPATGGALPPEPAARTLAARAGLVQVLVYAPGDRQDEPRRQIVAGGSGTLLARTGIVATAAHVATDPHYRVLVRTLDGQSHEGFTVEFDPNRDLALLCVPSLRHHPGAMPAHELPLEVRPVLGFGFAAPAGIAVAAGWLRPTQSGAPVRYGSFGIDRPIELELAIAPGYSGGPVLDTHGRLLGILAGFAMEFGAKQPRHLGIAYAVPATDLSGAALAEVLRRCRAREAA
jgi:S1-C subfamily serine protease